MDKEMSQKLIKENKRLRQELKHANATIKTLQDSISVAIAGIQAIRSENVIEKNKAQQD